MSLHFSEETHRNLVARVPACTGRELPEWFKEIEAGPSFSRFEDRVSWLQGEHNLGHGHALAIVREHGRRRHAPGGVA